jgi:RNA polymerase sigma factor (sigma-70 family)
VSIDWATVYRETYGDLVRFLHRFVWDEERAHDLAQETFVRALDQSPDNPRAWLFRVAGNLAKDEARTAVRRKKHLVLIKSDAQAQHSTAPDPVDDLDRANKLKAVREALAQLSERDRDVLLLWDAGMNYHDIAQETGMSVGAIGTTLARARRRLVEAHRELERQHAARG